MNKYNWIIAFFLTGISLFLLLDSLSHIPTYLEQHHLFLFGWDYLQAHLVTPGDRLDYLTDFVIQFFYYHFAGCLLFVLLLSSLYVLNYLTVPRITGGYDPLHLGILPPLYLIARYTSIDFPLNHLTGLFLCFLLFYILSLIKGKLKYYLLLLAAVLLVVAIGWNYPLAAAVVIVLSCLSASFFRRFVKSGKIKLAITLVVILCYAGSTFYSFVRSYNMHERLILEADSQVKNGQWDKVLTCAARYRGKNQLMDYFRNMALYHTGKLPYDLLNYPQSFGVESLYLPWTGENRRSEYGHYIYEQLGLINEAHHWAFESMVVNGETAPNLVNLVRYNIVMERPLVALKFINVLKKSLFYRKQAMEYEKIAFTGQVPGLKSLPHQEGLKARFTNVLNIGPDLQYLCDRNPSDRMAFEYLMSQLLLSNHVVRFANNVGRIRALNYPAMPRIYEEALLVYKLGVSEETFNQLGLTISSETEQRFNAYYALLQKGDMEKLKQQFGDTYWYYLNYLSIYGSKIIED